MGGCKHNLGQKKAWNPQVQVLKHLSKHLTFRWDLCYKCGSFQSASVKTQGMTQVILTFCQVSFCKHTLHQSFTTVVLAETMKFKKSSKHLSLVQVTPEFMETLGGNSSRFSCYLVKIISLWFKSLCWSLTTFIPSLGRELKGLLMCWMQTFWTTAQQNIKRRGFGTEAQT